MTHEEQFLAHLALIDSVIAFIARRHGLPEGEREDFAAHVRLKCIEDDYRVLREFGHRSTLRTYLTSVVHHLFLDFRNALWGKWRPSHDAVRQGPWGIRLDQLMNRDRMSFDEACERLHAETHGSVTREALERIAEVLPARAPRRHVGEEAVNGLAVDPSGVEAPLRLTEIAALRRRAHASLVTRLAALPADDRFLLRLRFERGMTVAKIADLRQESHKALYRRFDRLLARLRQDMQADGVDRSMIASLLDDPDGPRAVVSLMGGGGGKEE